VLLLEIIAGNFTGELNWLDSSRCEFKLHDVKYGVLFEEIDVTLPERTLPLMNVSFGVVHKEFDSEDDLDLSLTKLEQAPSVLNAVATAILEKLKSSDVRLLVFGGGDDSAERRANVYRLAASKLKHRLKFKTMKTVKTENDAVLNVLMKDDLSDEEVQFVLSGLNLRK
jgi:hypothetical protein